MSKFEKFEVDVEGGKINSTRWQIWLRRFDLFIEANGVTGDRKMIATLLNEAGSGVEEIYEAIRDTTVAKADEKYADIAKLITNHFAPQKNLNMSKLKFRETCQYQGENVDSYYVRLKTAAVQCEFGTSNNDEILLQLIQGSIDKRVKLKASQETVTLDNLLKYIRSLEFSSEVSVSSYKKEQGSCKVESICKLESRNVVDFNRIKQASTNKLCFRCGREFPHKGKCRALDQKCNKCGKLGHFAKCCKGGVDNKPKFTKHKFDNTAKRSYQIQTIKSSNADENINMKVNDENVTEIRSESYNLFSISNGDLACPRIMIDILGSTIEAGIDTQASINAISKQTFDKMTIKPELKFDNTIVYSFDGKKPMKSLGKFISIVKANRKAVKAEFLVFDDVRDNLLSYQTSRDLELVKLTFALESKEDVFHKNVVAKFPDLFSGKIGRLKDYKLKFHINKDIKPIIQKERKIPFHLKEAIEKAIDDMIVDDIIEPVSGEATPHVSCFVAVPKPSNPKEVRITLDAKIINKSIERERHNMPTLDELKAKLNGAKYISKIDFKGGYHQIEIDEESRYITVFRTPKGLMRYKRLVQGISCSSEMFQNAVEKILNGLNGVMNLIDDGFIWGSTEEEHDENLYAVLQRLQDKGLTLNPEKCVLKQKELEFFGMKFSSEGISITDEKVKALKEAKLPITQSELRSFLGFANFCSDSIPELAINARLLWKMTHSNKPKKIVWTEDLIKRFEMVKDTVSTTALSYFNKDWDTVLEVDAGPEGAGAVLYQTEPGDVNSKHIVCFWSKSFSDVEMRYSQVEKEALGVVLACEKFRLYLVGKKFLLYTDNKAVELIYKNPKSKPPARISRFNLRLMDLEFDIKHKPGKDNIADYLSRHPLKTHETNRETYLAEQYLYFISEQNAPRAVQIEQLMDATSQDMTLQAVIQAIKKNDFSNNQNLKYYKRFKDELSIYQDKLVLRGSRIVVPEKYWSQMVKIAHEGHLGIVKTKQLIRDRIWFPHIDKMVENEIQQCKACQLVGSSGYRPEPLKISEFPDRPWQKVQADFHILPDGTELLSIIDLFSSFPVVVGVPTTAHIYVIPKLESIFSLMGIPEFIRTDNGPPFQGYNFKDFCRNYGIKHIKTTPEWPQANGKIENFNKNLRRLIQKSFIDNLNWESELNNFLRAYRNAPQCSSQIAPSELIFVKSNSSKLPLRIQDLRLKKDIQMLAEENDQQAKGKMKLYADKRRKAVQHEFSVGDKVLVNQFHNKKVYNKIKSKAANELFEIKAIKGSMITAFSGNRELTRNVSLFKKAPDTMEHSYEYILNNNICCAEADKNFHSEHQEHNNVDNELVELEATPQIQVFRRSERIRHPVDRYVAEPASGLLNRLPKSR